MKKWQNGGTLTIEGWSIIEKGESRLQQEGGGEGMLFPKAAPIKCVYAYMCVCTCVYEKYLAF
jgi:hypothetical protein